MWSNGHRSLSKQQELDNPPLFSMEIKNVVLRAAQPDHLVGPYKYSFCTPRQQQMWPSYPGSSLKCHKSSRRRRTAGGFLNCSPAVRNIWEGRCQVDPAAAVPELHLEWCYFWQLEAKNIKWPVWPFCVVNKIWDLEFHMAPILQICPGGAFSIRRRESNAHPHPTFIMMMRTNTTTAPTSMSISNMHTSPSWQRWNLICSTGNTLGWLKLQPGAHPEVIPCLIDVI